MTTTSGKKEVFRFKEAAAQRVQLVGEFTNWEDRPIPMIKGSGGLWTATVILPRGKHQYLFIVDGERREDPECSERAPNASKTFNSVRLVDW